MKKIKYLTRHIRKHLVHEIHHGFYQVFHIHISDHMIHLMAFIGVTSFQLEEFIDDKDYPEFLQSVIEAINEKYWIIFMRIGTNPHKEVLDAAIKEAEFIVEEII